MTLALVIAHGMVLLGQVAQCAPAMVKLHADLHLICNHQQSCVNVRAHLKAPVVAR